VIKEIEHVALSVSNMERSLSFYRGLLGMKIVLEVDFSDERLGKIIGQRGVKARVVHLALGETILELFEYYEPRGKPLVQEHNQWDQGLIHIGFRSTDVQNDYENLKAKGVTFLAPPVQVRQGTWVAYFRGPDGEVCELRETPATKDARES